MYQILRVAKVLLSWYVYCAFFNKISIGNIKNHIIPIICIISCTIDGSKFTAQSQNNKNQTEYSCCHLWNIVKIFYIWLLQIAESEACESNGLNLPSWKFSKNGILLQVNLFQKPSFLHQLTHNMTRYCSLKKTSSQVHKSTCCVQKLFLTARSSKRSKE